MCIRYNAAVTGWYGRTLIRVRRTGVGRSRNWRTDRIARAWVPSGWRCRDGTRTRCHRRRRRRRCADVPSSTWKRRISSARRTARRARNGRSSCSVITVQWRTRACTRSSYTHTHTGPTVLLRRFVVVEYSRIRYARINIYTHRRAGVCTAPVYPFSLSLSPFNAGVANVSVGPSHDLRVNVSRVTSRA